MHELGITQEIVSIACRSARGARISRLVVEIGKLSAVPPDCVKFWFDLCSQDTAAEGALLEIIETPGRGRCRKCATEAAMDAPVVRCVCGSMDVEWLSGQELKIKEVE